MAQLLIRKLPDDVHAALKARAHAEGVSTEALVRNLLIGSVRPSRPAAGVGTALAALGQHVGLSNDEWDAVLAQRDRAPAEPPQL